MEVTLGESSLSIMTHHIHANGKPKWIVISLDAAEELRDFLNEVLTAKKESEPILSGPEIEEAL